MEYNTSIAATNNTFSTSGVGGAPSGVREESQTNAPEVARGPSRRRRLCLQWSLLLYTIPLCLGLIVAMHITNLLVLSIGLILMIALCVGIRFWIRDAYARAFSEERAEEANGAVAAEGIELEASRSLAFLSAWERESYLIQHLPYMRVLLAEDTGSNDGNNGSNFLAAEPSDNTDVDPEQQQHPEICCAICLSTYVSGDEVCFSTNASCSHTFHRMCMITWLLRNNEEDKCPCCRQTYLLLDHENDLTKDGFSSLLMGETIVLNYGNNRSNNTTSRSSAEENPSENMSTANDDNNNGVSGNGNDDEGGNRNRGESEGSTDTQFDGRTTGVTAGESEQENIDGGKREVETTKGSGVTDNGVEGGSHASDCAVKETGSDSGVAARTSSSLFQQKHEKSMTSLESGNSVEVVVRRENTEADDAPSTPEGATKEESTRASDSCLFEKSDSSLYVNDGSIADVRKI